MHMIGVQLIIQTMNEKLYNDWCFLRKYLKIGEKAKITKKSLRVQNVNPFDDSNKHRRKIYNPY